MPKLTVVAKAKARPGCEKDLERALRDVVGPTHQEPGCLRYALHRSIEDPALFVVVERWKSREDLDRHFATPHVKALFAKAPQLVAAPPEILILETLPEGQSEKSEM